MNNCVTIIHYLQFQTCDRRKTFNSCLPAKKCSPDDADDDDDNGKVVSFNQGTGGVTTALQLCTELRQAEHYKS